MSRTIDERVVSMQFDNKQFESNVQTSLGTLDKLKQSLNLKGVSKGLDGVNSSVRKIDMSSLGNAAYNVGLKFSAMYSMADQAFRNITNAAMATGKKIVSAFTIDPVKTGLAEYETQINAVQTILANTQSKGTTLDDVNGALDELNTYADKTIYNFTEMTRNIGTFTAAGVDLDKSVSSIKGIANLAAVSGSTSQQASTAMYQLSQALAAGKVSLMDWNSVVNAGMGGQLFQDALKRTAKQMGHNVDAIIEKYGSFRESLTQGEWLTTEVLTETLTQLSGAYSEADLIAQGYTKEQAKEIYQLSETAVNAATKVKTFTQLMDTLKEAAQSGWTQTWEILIGDFEEAKELWTNVSDTFGEFINKSSESRNQLLEGAMTSNWDKLITKINDAGIETSTFEDKLKKTVKEHGFDVDKLIKDHGSLEEAFRSGAVSSDILKEAVDGLGTSLVDLSGIEGELKKGDRGDDVKKAQEALKELGHDLGKWGVDGIFGSQTEAAVKAFQELNGLEVTGIIDDATLKALEDATTKANQLGDSCDGLIDGIEELGGREILIESLKNIFEGLMSVIRPIKAAFRSIFPPMTSEQLLGYIKGFRDLTERFKLSLPQMIKLRDTFKGIFSVIDIGWTFIKALAGGIVKLIGKFSGLGGGILEVTGSWGKWLTGLRDSIKEADIFGIAVDKILAFIEPLISGLKKVGSFLKDKFKAPGFEGFLNIMKSIWNVISKIGSVIGKVASSIGNALANAFSSGDISAGLDIINSGLITGVLLKFRSLIGEGWSGLFGDISDGFAGIKDVLDTVKGSLETWQSSLKAGILLKIGIAIGILAAAILVLSTIDPGKLAASLTAITVLFADLMGSMAIFSRISGDMKNIMRASIAMIAVSTAVLILASALKKISDLSWEELAVGLVGVAGLMAIVVASAKILSSGEKTIVKGAASMVILAFAVKILASACKELSSMSWEELAKGLVGVGVLMAEIAIFLNVAKFSGKTITTATGIVILAAAIKILASACRDFSSMRWEDIGKGLAAIGGLLLEIAIFTKLTGNAKHIISTGLALVLIGASMKIFASACSDFASMSWEELARGLVGVAGALLAVTIAMNFMPKNMIGIGIGLTIVSASLMILATVLERMGNMSWEDIAKGLVALGGSIAILAIGLNFMTGTLAGSAALLIAAASLAILTPTLKTLGSMSWKSIFKGLITIAGAFAVIAAAGILLSPVVPAILGLAGAFALIGVAVLAVGVGLAAAAAGLTALALAGTTGATAIVAALTIIVTGIAGLIPVVAQKIGEGIVAFCGAIADGSVAIGEAIKAVVLTLVDVLVECIPTIADGALKLIVGVLDALVKYTPQIIESLFEFLISLIDGLAVKLPELTKSAINLIMKLFTSVTDALTSMDSGTLIKGAIGLGLMSGLMIILSAVAGFIPGAMIGVLGMGAVIAELAIVIAALGALAQIPGFEWLIGEGGDLLQKIGNALGGFVGGIIGGIAEGITASLPQIATDLSNFMENLTPFIEGAKSVDSSMMDGVSSIAKIILTLTAANILEGLTAWFTGGSSLEKFGNELIPFGESLVNFSNSVSSLSDDDVTKMTTIAKMVEGLVDIANKVPETGGLKQAIVGTPDLVTFAAGLTSLGAGIASFNTSVADMTETDATKLTTIGTTIDKFVEIANKVPETGGLTQAIVGTPDLVTFASGLSSLGEAISSFNTSVADMTEADATKLTTIGTTIDKFVEIANKVPETGGLTQAITGTPDLVTFANSLVSLGSGITTFNQAVVEVSETDATKLSSIGTMIDKFVEIANKVPETGGLTQAITGTPDLVTFANNLVSLGAAIVAFNESVADVTTDDTTKLSDIGTAIDKFVEVAAKVPETGGLTNAITGTPDIVSFANGLSTLGGAISTFNTSVADVTTEDAAKLTEIGTVIDKFVEVSKKIPESGGLKQAIEGTPSLSEFAGELKTFGEAICDFAGAVTDVSNDDVTKITNIGDAAKTLVGVASSLKEYDDSEWFNTNLTEFAGELKTFGEKIAEYSDEIKDVDTTKFTGVANAARTIIGLCKDIGEDGGSTLNTFGTNIKNFGTNIKKFSENIIDIDTGNISTVMTEIGKLGDIDLSGLETLGDNLGQIGKTSVKKFLDAFTNAGSQAVSAGMLLVNSLIQGVSTRTTIIVKTFTTIAQQAVTSIKNQYNNFYNAGKHVVQGFASGITVNTFRAEAAAKAMAKKAYEAAKKALDINSPSKIFRSLGTSVPEGFAMGIDKLGGMVKSSATSMADTAINGTKNAIARISDAINSDIDAQPTIRPVLDLSEVSAGAGTIEGMLSGRPSIGVMSKINTISSMMNSRQNGANSDVISAIENLGRKLGNTSGDTYNINGVTYDDGSNITDAVKTLVRAAKVERRS